MGWWVKNHIAVNDDETKQLCSIEADTSADLPTVDQSSTAGFIIVRGSDAKDVATGDIYVMDSTGTWKLQPSGVHLDLSGYATTQDLMNGLANKADKTEIYSFMPNIDSNTTITAYADNLATGHYVSFYANTNRPTDAPVEANTVVEIYKYSINTVIIRVLPISTTYMNQFYQRIKTGGMWRGWIKFEGVQI